MAYFHTTVLDNQIKALPTIDTASGSIATFDTDRAERLVNLEVAITATGGGGTPVSPIAINGFSACDLVHFGEQLFNFYNYPATINANGITWTCTSNGLIRAKGTATARSQIYVRLTQEQASVFNGKYFTNLIPSNMSCAIEQDGSPFTVFATNNSVIDTITANVTMYFRVESGQGVDCVFLPTIVDTASDITINTINFGQTVANGVLDVTTGKLRVTHKIGDLGSVIWSPDPNRTGRFYGGLSGRKPASWLLLCDSLQVNNVGTNSLQDNQISGRSDYGSTAIFARIDSQDGKTGAEFKTYVTGMKVSFELATPIEIQLNSTQITALLNENNIWCDTGDTSVKYILSVGKAIN